MRSEKETITVQFAVWTPFEEHLDEKEISLDMAHGALLYPGMKMVYKAYDTSSEKVCPWGRCCTKFQNCWDIITVASF